MVPTVTGLNSALADGRYAAGQAVPITVTFSEAVTVTGTPTLTLETGAKTYEGPILTYVLRAGGLPVGPKLHGDPLRAYVVMTGKDGFQALYALAELDKDFHDDVVILADHVDGKPLPEKEAPWRVASSGDKKGWRSVFGLARIEARTADAPAKAPAMDHQH